MYSIYSFSFGSLSHYCCHDVPCGNNWAHSFSVEEIRVFQACLVENPSVQVLCFENHAEWRFCLAPFVCRALLAHWRLVGAVALGWRSGARASCPFLWFSPFAHARFCWTFILTHATALKPSHSKQVISTAPSSTSFEPFKVIQDKLIVEMLVTILHCKKMFCYRRTLPSTFITSDTERNWDQWCVTVWYQEDSPLKQADMSYSSPLWTRWTMNMAWGKPFATYQKQESRLTRTLENHFKTQQIGANYCPLEKRTAFLQKKRSNAVILYDTLPAEFIEKAVCMETKEHLYQRESARPRIVLTANSQCRLQDLPRQEARWSWETQSDAQSFWKIGCNILDYRVSGISISTVQQKDEQRRPTVAKLIEKFESHQYKV